MLAKTHAAFGILTGLFLANFIGTGNLIAYYSLILIGSLLPDIDTPNSKAGKYSGGLSRIINALFGHREIFHTLFMALFFYVLLAYFAGVYYGNAIAIGYVSHLLIDGLTKKGVKLLHPVAQFNLSGFIETGGAGELVIFLLILVGIAVQIV